MKRHKIKIPIYGGTLNLILVDEIAEVAEEFKIGEPKRLEAVTFQMNAQYYIVMKFLSASPGTITHECKHFVNFLFLARDIKLDPYNDEPECYLLGWVVEQIHKLIPKPN